MNQFSLEKNASTINVVGELTRHTIDNKNQNSIEPYLTGSDIIIDLSSVNKIDTAGLAWLLLVIEQSYVKRVKLHFTHLSDELVKLAKLSGVESLISTAE